MKSRSVCSLLLAGVLAFAGSPVVMGATMQAAVYSDGAIRVETVPVPEPGAGQVRIKVHAASVNPVDWLLADRAAPGSSQIPGRDLSGVIDALGEGAAQWKVGDEVIAVAGRGGAYAEYVVVSADTVAPKPAKMSFEEAAGVPVVAETAWRSLITVGNVQKGQRVLIHGAAGGVGTSAVQIARARGAYVIGTASARNHEFLKSLGADEVIDYNTTRFEDVVKDVDLVLNAANAETNTRSVGVVRKGGILVSVVGAPPMEACSAAGIRCSDIGRVNGQMLPAIVDFANAGNFRISVEHRMPLAEAGKAWELNRARHTRGKIILVVSPPST